MKLNDNGTAETYWTDKQDVEWTLKISYTMQEFEPEQPNPDLPGVGPGCEWGIIDMQIERREYTNASNGTASDWVLFNGCTDKEVAAYAVEIMEAINQQAMDDRGNEE